MNKRYTLEQQGQFISKIAYMLRDKINLEGFDRDDWIIPLTEFEVPVNPVQYNGKLLRSDYILFNGVLYREDKQGNLRLVPLNEQNKRLFYRVYDSEGKKVNLWQGKLVKENYLIIPESFHLHHLDGDRTNNHPTNLCMMEGFIHNQYHGTKISNKVNRIKFFDEYINTYTRI